MPRPTREQTNRDPYRGDLRNTSRRRAPSASPSGRSSNSIQAQPATCGEYHRPPTVLRTAQAIRSSPTINHANVFSKPSRNSNSGVVSLRVSSLQPLRTRPVFLKRTVLRICGSEGTVIRHHASIRPARSAEDRGRAADRNAAQHSARSVCWIAANNSPREPLLSEVLGDDGRVVGPRRSTGGS